VTWPLSFLPILLLSANPYSKSYIETHVYRERRNGEKVQMESNLALHGEDRGNISRFTPPEVKANIVGSDVLHNRDRIDFLRQDFKEFALGE
jgi:hypothetical protein